MPNSARASRAFVSNLLANLRRPDANGEKQSHVPWMLRSVTQPMARSSSVYFFTFLSLAPTHPTTTTNGVFSRDDLYSSGRSNTTGSIVPVPRF